ncbi:HAUS augmin-like complex subunit 7 [Diadema antillarum]|uniref:HAUS augmin-like complex subunit 7 n=1 Tax=Diadema antillarum TaxID=105358 RepID=UPI003A8A1369
MSRQSKSKTSQEKLSRSFKQRFDALDCPFVDGVDESWIAELLYQPGEARIRLLQWLLSRYDSKLAEMFDSQYWTSESKMDARLQVITEVCAYLGICRPGDIDLVRGVSTSHSSQAAFWDKLLDIVYISDMCDESRALGVSSHGVVSESLPLWDQFSSDCHFISSLAHGRDLQETLSTKQSLFPPDITRTLAKRAAAAEEQGGEQKSPPNMDALLEMSTHLSMELIQANQHLTELKEALLSSLRSMHASYDGIVNTKLAPHEGKEAIDGADLLASVSQAALKSYGEFISVMEESISRNHETWSESTLLSQSFR